MIEHILAGVLMVALTFYALMGGADYGAGVWALLARGPLARQQRELIATAIGPIWEANHVWLILVVTVLFTAFPPVFALITTMLHLPLVLLLIGIVLRGSAFAFRAHDVAPRTDLSVRAQVFWESVFAVSSLITPVLLGVAIGAIASGRLQLKGDGFLAVFVHPWLAPFPFAVGLFALALFAFLAAVYLILETRRDELREAFRRHALAASAASAVLAMIVFALARTGAPEISDGLSKSAGGRVVLLLAALSGLGAIVLLWKRRFRLARLCAVAEVTFVLWGWAFAQYPYLIEPSLTISNAAAPPQTLRLLLGVLLLGAILLFPSLYYLYRIFKSRAVFGRSS
ncbi:MAG TPA: cytochrome d ubiquinol oxidase subunit II [Nitrospiraceae bacterium]|nr:cytochrome d ubiquinol oxidase subunit II [Nitrospiraceae bacterium]